MEERFVKLNVLAEDETKASEIFSGTIEEVRSKLLAEGIEFSDEEYAEFIKGLKLSVKEGSELCEEDLESVAGGCDVCYNQGQRVGKVVGKVLSVGKWILSLFA